MLEVAPVHSKYQYHNPAFVVLFHLPPTRADQTLERVGTKHTKSQNKKSSTDSEVSQRRIIVAIPIPQPSISAIRPITADKSTKIQSKRRCKPHQVPEKIRSRAPTVAHESDEAPLKNQAHNPARALCVQAPPTREKRKAKRYPPHQIPKIKFSSTDFRR